MFINPKVAIDNGWVICMEDQDQNEDFDWKKHIQPNALDFTLDNVYTIDPRAHFFISEEKKQMRGGKELVAEFDAQRQETYWRLDTGVYDGMSNFYVTVPEGVAAYMIIRSTFNRNGIFITSGLYDSGFKGHIGFAVHNRSGVAFISPGTRIGQLIFVQSENTGIYAGGYNHDIGTHHTEKK